LLLVKATILDADKFNPDNGRHENQKFLLNFYIFGKLFCPQKVLFLLIRLNLKEEKR
jgi:hypothetical protein